MKRIILAAVAFGTLLAGAASAETILAPGSVWEYTFAAPGWNWDITTGVTTSDPQVGWTSGRAPFGNNTGGWDPWDTARNFDYATYWPEDTPWGNPNYDLFVRTTIDLTGFDLKSVSWDLGADNGYCLLANGNFVSNGFAELYTYRWEYSGGFGNTLLPGKNIIALALDDRGGLTAFDMQITGNRIAPVPEPGTMLLLGSGLLGLAGVIRRKT